jgi:phosphonate transport system substrate-binding protein
MVAFGLLIASAAGAADRQSLGIVPYYAPEKIWTLFSPLAEYLTRATGTTWSLKLFSTQDELVKGVADGEVSVAFLGPVPFGRASRKCALRPLLVARAADGAPWYRSVLVTTDPSVRTLANLRGKTFGFFQGSTAAHVVPRRMLEDAGLKPDAYRSVFLKGQDRIVDALLKREIAAAGIKKSLYEKFRGMGLVALLDSGPLPNFCFCATRSLSADAEKKFVSALTSLKTGPGEADHKRVQSWDDELRYGFVAPPDGYAGAAARLAEDFETFALR